MEDFNSLGYFWHNLKTLILKIIAFLWITNSATISVNFFFSLNFLKTCPWWYATFIIPFFFVLMISSYRLTISAALSGFKSSLSKTLSIIIESSNFVLISSFDKRAFLLSAEPFYKQKINTLRPNLKTKKYLYCINL